MIVVGKLMWGELAVGAMITGLEYAGVGNKFRNRRAMKSECAKCFGKAAKPKCRCNVLYSKREKGEERTLSK